MSELKFVDLHVHTKYSIGSSLSNVDEIVDKASEYGMTALAITDTASMSGIPEFYLRCKEAGIKPIIGCGFYFDPGLKLNEEEVNTKKYHIVLLAKNKNGYKNLLKLMEYSYTKGFNGFPQINMEIIAKYSSDLICLSGGMGGVLDELLKLGEKFKAIEVTEFFIENLGEENFYIELQEHEFKNNKTRMLDFINFSLESSIPMVVTGGSFYVMRTDSIWCNELRRNTGTDELEGNSYYFKAPDEILKEFKDYKDAVVNTNIVSKMCNTILDEKKLKELNFTVDDNELENVMKQLELFFNLN